MLFCMVVGKVKLVYSRRNTVAFLFLSLAYFIYGITIETFKSALILFGTLITFWLIINLNTIDKRKCLNYITTGFTLLMIPSLILWLINWVMPLPTFGTVQIDNDVLAYLPYDNYIIFVKSAFYFFRFNGPFLEPGHVGMMTAFLVYANRYNFRDWRIVAISFIMLFTLSLSGYVLLTIGFFLNRFADSAHIIKVVLLAGVFLFIGYNVALTYNNGHNYVNELILDRLQYDEEKGFTGNNRVFGQIDNYYRFLLNNSQYFWTGYDKKTIKYLAETGSRGTGYVMYVVMHGFLGLIITALFYIFYALSSSRRKYALLFFLFVCFVFWQRCYPFWTSWLICYVGGISLYEDMKAKEAIEAQPLRVSKKRRKAGRSRGGIVALPSQGFIDKPVAPASTSASSPSGSVATPLP